MLDFTLHPLLYKGIKVKKKKIDAAFLSYMYTESSRRERQLQGQSIMSEELLGRSFEKRVRSSWSKHQGLCVRGCSHNKFFHMGKSAAYPRIFLLWILSFFAANFAAYPGMH